MEIDTKVMRNVEFKILILFLLVAGNSKKIYGQFDQEWAYTYHPFIEEKVTDKDLYFDIVGNNFFKNNEYESEFLQGYTLSGYSLQPTLEYYTNPDFRIMGGVNLLKYNGIGTFTQVIPIVSAHLKLTSNLQLIMGALKGGIQHEMLEPIFNSERQYSRPVENGAQFLYDSKHLKVDFWGDWEQFIFEGDTIPEKFSIGLNANYLVSSLVDQVKFTIPFQFLARHVGGEISNYTDEVQTYVNIATGVKMDAVLQGGFIKGVRSSVYYLGYKDAQNTGLLGVTQGKALYADCALKYKYGEFYTGYFTGHNFMGVMGNGLFNAVSSGENYYYQPDRSVVLNKFSLVKEFFHDLRFGLTLQSYYDVGNNDFMYSYGFSIVVKNARKLF